ncbi:GNAT family N-acetyltransferase [Paraburkholderia acidipaludis]|uniref:GNAT family N-acetyltransferase n=1 Tax=Paraburkholderia acidipaludis TaxID=660537 RepID=UPI00048332A3|nr:GNAT family N-acetyltransferase [Paraburkholderia acidipaludis]
MAETTLAEQKAGTAHPLDNAIWNALTGRHGAFMEGDGRVRRYTGTVAPFGAMADTSPESFRTLHALTGRHGPTALVTVDEIVPPAAFSITRRDTLLQMVWQGEPDHEDKPAHVKLTAGDVPDMLALVAATQPGPFGPRTIELGTYIGMRHEGKLAAMAGERIKPDGFTEISAVCVDPAFRGQGLAARLMKRLISAIAARAETPFLHVVASNRGAIALYEKLGFVERRAMHLMVLGVAQR